MSQNSDRTGSDQNVLKRFAETITFPTVSLPGSFSLKPFHRMRECAVGLWPGVFSAMEMHLCGEASILLLWHGRDSGEKPVMLTAHQDVVPAGESGWTCNPFGGEEQNGRIYGRGTVDYKCGFAGMLEACQQLINSGFSPSRTVILSFGHDEEVGGLKGAAAVASKLAQMGIRCSSVLDEGGYIYQNDSGGDTAVIALAEKGYATFRLVAHAVQGHSSTPSERTAIGTLARAVSLLEELGLTLPEGTTIAPTVFTSGCKENVLPGTAELLLNTRPAPGTSVESVQNLVTGTVETLGVSVELLENPSLSEPSPVSDSNSRDFQDLKASVRAVLGNSMPVEEGVFPAATDSRRYRLAADDTYRFMPVHLGSRGVGMLHSVNENISVTDYLDCVSFYAEYIRRAAGNR